MLVTYTYKNCFSVNWTGEDLPRNVHSQSQPQLRALGRAPLPPPRRTTAGPIQRSRSTDIVPHSPHSPLAPHSPRSLASLEEPAPADPSPRPLPDAPPRLIPQATEEESTDSSLMEDDNAPKPRKRRIHLPFGKKTKTPA